ncbi:MAG: hypothetical protein FJ293_03255 [Planctomycetes bacterium]|nr:hypothetical protein [Planctomycetota bacterium]
MGRTSLWLAAWACALQERTEVEAPVAAAELAPVLAKIAADPGEGDHPRRSAIWKLGELGETGAAALCGFIADERNDLDLRGLAITMLGETGADLPDFVRPWTKDAAPGLRARALAVLARMEERSGRSDPLTFWAGQIEAAPFDPHVGAWVSKAAAELDPVRALALRREVAERWQARLDAEPTAELALQLAGYLRGMLHATVLVSANRIGYQPKEDPQANFAVIDRALRVAQATAEKGTPPWQQALRGLAQDALLRGDWEAMNAALVELGQAPVAAERRPWLAPPPEDWTVHPERWQECGEALRSGTASYELKVEKGGRGLAGVHVGVAPLLRAPLPSLVPGSTT